MRPTLILALTVAAVLALVAAAPASAGWYMTKRGVERRAEISAERRYGEAIYGVYCRPQGLRRADPEYVYHRWVCYWANDNDCDGALLIVGSRQRGAWYSRVVHGQRCAIS